MRLNGMKPLCYTIMFFASLALLSNFAFSANSDYIQSLMDSKHIETKLSSKRDTDYPSRAKPDPAYEHQELYYWVEKVLPFDQDKNARAYVVYPEQGIIYPILTLSIEDKNLILSKQKFDHYKYLQEGGLHYIDKSPMEGRGNMVIAIHSAYYTKDEGRYKTAGQATILANPGSKIRYFEKQADGSYTRFEYNITESQETSSKDTSILFPTKDIEQITIYTCYEIGSSEGRRYNKADLISRKDGFSLIEPIVSEPRNEESTITETITSEPAPESTPDLNEEEQQLSSDSSDTLESIAHYIAPIASNETNQIQTYIEPIRQAMAALRNEAIRDSFEDGEKIQTEVSDDEELEQKELATINAVETAHNTANYLKLYAYQS